MISGEIVFDFDIDARRIIRAFNVSDDVGAIIRLHYELDRVLTHVLAKFFVSPKHLGARYTQQKIDRLRALGFGGPRLDLATQINTLRNDFAHRDKEILTASDIEMIESFVRSLSQNRTPKPDGRVVVGDFSGTYSSLTLRQKLVVLTGGSIISLASLPHEIDAANSARSKDTSSIPK